MTPHKDFSKNIQELKEIIIMFVCPTCKVADNVWYDTKGDSLDEDIYHCLKCGYYFMVHTVCNKCDSSHNRSYGCNTKNCNCIEYHYDHEEIEIER